jgi:D-alanyl-D-alanine carboxypeptidase (penicillin-binding protein 5/6)
MKNCSVVYCAVLTAVMARSASAQPKSPPDRLDGPPIVSAKAWAVADGATGQVLWGDHESEPRPIASTTKIMTAYVVLGLAEIDAKVLNEVVTFSEQAAKTTGSSAKLKAGERLSVREILYGLLLPSGNDAAVALAEQFGRRFPADGSHADDPVRRFVAEMNRQARKLELKATTYLDPNGLSRNESSPRDLATLTWRAMQMPLFRDYVATRRHECAVVVPAGEKRTVVWENTSHLLAIDGYDGVKTGTTAAAGGCLVASGRRGNDRLLVVILGGAAGEARYTDARNLFRWAWQQRGPSVLGWP